jgi:hypothetical protein
MICCLNLSLIHSSITSAKERNGGTKDRLKKAKKGRKEERNGRTKDRLKKAKKERKKL